MLFWWNIDIDCQYFSIFWNINKISMLLLKINKNIDKEILKISISVSISIRTILEISLSISIRTILKISISIRTFSKISIYTRTFWVRKLFFSRFKTLFMLFLWNIDIDCRYIGIFWNIDKISTLILRISISKKISIRKFGKYRYR